MNRLFTVVLVVFAAGAAYAQSTSVKLPTASSTSDFTVTDSSNIVLLKVMGNGRVGFGTSSPNEPFEAASPSARAIISDAQGANRRGLLLVGPISTADYARIATIGYGNSGGGKPLLINRAIDGKGKVGIGINNIPTQELEVGGIIYSDTLGFMFPDGTIQTTAAGASQWTTSGSNIYYSTGKVGIGTSSPGEALEVNGKIYSSSGGFKFPDGSVQTTAAGTASQWATSGSNIYYSTGKVGIGTNNPSATLDVSGGDVCVSGSNNFTYSSAKTHYYSVSGLAFELEHTSGSDHRQVSGGSIYDDGGNGIFQASYVAPVNLPDGATVTGVTFYVVDNDGTYNPGGGQLWRNDASTLTPYGNIDTMATVLAPASANSLNIQSSSTTTISNPVIDNQNYLYLLRWVTQQNNANIRLVRVLITYTVTKTN